VIDLASNRACGGEVLWRPGGIPPSPEQQASLKEDPALSITITQQALAFALRQLERLQGGVWLAVNLSCCYVRSGLSFSRPILLMAPDLGTMRHRVGRRLLTEITEKVLPATRSQPSPVSLLSSIPLPSMILVSVMAPFPTCSSLTSAR